MLKLSYASTKQKDQLYIARIQILDDFFFMETDDAQYVFLDAREFGVFNEYNKNPRMRCVALEELMNKTNNISGEQDPAHKLALQIIKDYRRENEPVEVPYYFPLDMADYLRSEGIVLQVKRPFISEREFKNGSEIEAIEKSIRKTKSAYQLIEQILRNSIIENENVVYRGSKLTSEFLKQEVTKVLVEQGMLNTEGIIISCGKYAAIPHHPGNGAIKAHQTIICDLFPVSQESGYFADMTRTYVKGAPSEKLQKMYDAVREAQEAGIEAIKPGVSTKDVHALVSGVFIKAGFEVGTKGFVHGTGHGLGLDIHEDPRINDRSDIVLMQGHVVTVEPGLYYPELGGVRIEDVVCVTENGCRNLTNYPKIFCIE